VVICAKTAELIEMSFGLWALMDLRNHLLDESPEVLGMLPWQPVLGCNLL